MIRVFVHAACDAIVAEPVASEAKLAATTAVMMGSFYMGIHI